VHVVLGQARLVLEGTQGRLFKDNIKLSCLRVTCGVTLQNLLEAIRVALR
jgi:hypothetical protein